MAITPVQHECGPSLEWQTVERALQPLNTLLSTCRKHGIVIRRRLGRIKQLGEIIGMRYRTLPQLMLLQYMPRDRKYVSLGRANGFPMRDAQHTQIYFLYQIGRVLLDANARQQKPPKLLTMTRHQTGQQCVVVRFRQCPDLMMKLRNYKSGWRAILILKF